MGRDIPIGRLAGFRIGMSWAVPLIALLFAYTLAENRFPITAPGSSTGTYWLAGLAGALLFFLSLLAHELGHALVARSQGIGVQGISLWILGGVTKMDRESDTAGGELKVAGIGPLASAAVGLMFLFLRSLLGDGIGATSIYADLFGWLGVINLLLAALNMLPGSPLDGGKVMGALLWSYTGDQTRGQLIAARLGQVLGAILLGLGALLTLLLGNPNGIWLMFVGGFILFAASSEAKSGPSLGYLRRIPVTQVMAADPPVVPEWMSIHDVVAAAAHFSSHTAVASQAADGRITGLLTLEAVQASDPGSWTLLSVADLAFPLDRVPTVGENTHALDATQRAEAAPSHRVLVTADDGRLIGVAGTDAADRALHSAAPTVPSQAGPAQQAWTPPG